MKTLHKTCAGLDVHKAEVVACLRLISKRKVEREVRRFPTTTQGLLALATHVAMEATGVYWKPVWHILEGRFALILANAAHVKNVPGRKSDVNDATWLADLLAHGLIPRIRKGAPWLKPVLVQAAWGAARKKNSYFQAQFLRLKARHGAKKAAIAVAASILTTVYHMLRDGTYYQDLGPEYFTRRNPAQAAARLANRIRNLGYHVEIRAAA
jgi:transposase